MELALEFLIIAALLVLAFIAWQLWRAKQFTQFKQYLEQEIKPLVFIHVHDTLVEARCETFPNTQAHIDATKYYWAQYKVRILQYALEHEILDIEALKAQGKYRFCQHLFHVEQDKLHHFEQHSDENKKSA